VKMSLLEIVVDILNDMDSDEVNSITDTAESLQVAQIVKSTYYAMLSDRNWPHTRRTITFTPLVDVTKPTHLLVPELVKEVLFVNYDKALVTDTRSKYGPIKWKEPDDFLRLSNNLNRDNTNVLEVQDFGGSVFLIRNDTAPCFYTSFDDKHIVCDSYDSVVDNTLQESKVQAMGYVYPLWEMEDDFIPDLPAEAFISLQEEAKSRASLKLRQVADQKAEQESTRQRHWLSRKAWTINGGIKYPDYGRRGKRCGRV